MGVAQPKNKNLNDIIYNNIHKPRMGKKPLYATISGVKGENGEVIDDNLGTFNSPKNIKHVIIRTDVLPENIKSYAHIDYFTPYMISGKPGNKLSADENGVVANSTEVTAIYEFNSNCNKYQMERAINSKAKKPIELKFSGSGFGLASYPYVLNNVEEIVLSVESLFIDDDKQYLTEIYQALGCNNYDNETILKAVINATQSGVTGIKNAQSLGQLFVKHNSGGTKDISKRYPRLKRIGIVIGNVSSEQVHDMQTHSPIEKLSQKALVFAYEFRKNNLDNTEFVLAENTYKFDKLVLKEYVNKLKETLKKQYTFNNGVDADKVINDVESRDWIKTEYKKLGLNNKTKKQLFLVMLQIDKERESSPVIRQYYDELEEIVKKDIG